MVYTTFFFKKKGPYSLYFFSLNYRQCKRRYSFFIPVELGFASKDQQYLLLLLLLLPQPVIKIAKTGSLCCVAARPHGSNTTSRDWSVGPHEPYWRTNTSFSPPPSRWDFHVLQDGIRFDESSTSSNSKESQSWARGNHLHGHHQYSASDGAGLFLSSPSDFSQGPQWTPPAIQEINIDDYETARRRDAVLTFAPTMEGASRNVDVGGSFSSCSDSGESEPTVRPRLSSHRNFSSRRFFMSKPVHPLSFPTKIPRETPESAVAGLSDIDAATSRRDTHSWSSGSSSIDSADVPEPIESGTFARPLYAASNGYRCGLCDRFLSQRSPWSSRRIVRSGDMPVAGVLPCRHVFHAECLEQTTPKAHKNDPPCPLCIKAEDEISPLSRVRNNFPRLRPFCEDGSSSRPWGCVQVGDCVEGALHAPPRNSMLLLNHSRIRKNLSLRCSSNRDFPGKLKKPASYNTQHLSGKSADQSSAGCSRGKEKALW